VSLKSGDVLRDVVIVISAVAPDIPHDRHSSLVTLGLMHVLISDLSALSGSNGLRDYGP
jgi:hypothetical protein